MTHPEASVEELLQSHPPSPEGDGRVASVLRDRSRAPSRELAQRWLAAPLAPPGTRSFLLLSQLEETGLLAALEVTRAPGVVERVQAISLAVDLELAFRRRLVEALDELLDDRRPVPVPGSGGLEEATPPHRICDEAYLGMRQIVTFGADDLGSLLDDRRFLAADEVQRDAAITRARALPAWQRALGRWEE